MKKPVFFSLMAIVLFGHSALSDSALVSSGIEYAGSSYESVWNKLSEEQYSVFPHHRIVSAGTLKSVASVLMNATLDNRNDFRPRRVKLVHANGICLSGKWEIESETPYSGYFQKGSQALVIARASVTQDYVDLHEYRAFGLAVKLFPTLDAREDVYTSNLFSVDTIEGQKNLHFVDSMMTNQIPDFDFLNIKALVRLATRLPFLVTFNNMSKDADTGPENRNPLLRRTLQVASAGISKEFSAVKMQERLPSYKDLSQQGQIKEPTWLAFKPMNVSIRSRESDFRNEIIDVVRKNGEFKYSVMAADEKINNQKVWSKIGTITFKEVVASLPCDQDLHFHHPRTDD